MQKHFTLLLLLVLPGPVLAQSRIDPAGIDGSLLICGGEPSEAAIEKFFDLAGGSSAKVAVLFGDRPPHALLKRLNQAAEKGNALEAKMIPLKDAATVLPKLTGVWVVGEPGLQDLDRESPRRREFRALLKRSGVIAVSGEPTALHLLGVLPPELRDLRTVYNGIQKKAEVLEGQVVFDVPPGSALLIRGRTLSTLGPQPVGLSLWHSKTQPGRRISLQAKAQEDLTALRRAARDRLQNFPPAKPEAPVVPKGTLVIVGGGGSPDGLYSKFVEYAGGAGKARIVILPTAQPDPIPSRDILAVLFKKAGAQKVTLLKGRTLKEVESPEYLDALKEATGLWFDGGRQWRFVDAYEDTQALPLMFDVLKRGGVIGGTSAGATIQGDYLARGGVFNNADIRYEGYERGLGFLKGVAIDQHFTQRKRQADMTSLMRIYPQYLGIGIDEATAIVVQGSTAEVIGKGKVHFYDATRKIEQGQPDYEALSAGARYDLRQRQVLPSREKK